MKRLDYPLFTLPLCALVVLGVACDPVIETDDTAAEEEEEEEEETLGPDEPEPEPEPEPDPGETSGETGGVDPVDPVSLGEDGVAHRFEDLPMHDPGAGESTSTSGGEPAHDPQALVIDFATLPETCGQPSPVLPCGEHASITLILAPEHQAVGTYVLFEQVDAFSTATGPMRDDPEDCWWGGGTLSGMLEITAIDEHHIEGRLFDTDAFDFDANVSFDVPIC
jgi:hypothetical protein